MPDKIIAIPGVGNIAFPDTMSDDDIAAASKKIYDEKQGAFGLTSQGLGQKTTASAGEPEGPVEQAWRTANTPLIPAIATAAHAIAEKMDQPRLDRSKLEAQISGYFAGATGAAGDFLSNLTSPVGLAMTLAQLGPESALVKAVPGLKTLTQLPAVREAQKIISQFGGATFTGEGVRHAFTAPSLPEAAQGVGQAAMGVLGVAQPAPMSAGERATAADRASREANDLVSRRVLAPANPRYKPVAQDVAPELLARGVKGDRIALQQYADDLISRADQSIDDVMAKEPPTATISTEPILKEIDAELAKTMKGGQVNPVLVDYNKELSRLRNFIANAGPDMSLADLRSIRQQFDEVAAEQRAFAGRSGSAELGAKAAAAETAGNATRRQIAAQRPELTDANADMHLGIAIRDILDPAKGRPTTGLVSTGVTGGMHTTGAIIGEGLSNIPGFKALGAFLVSDLLPRLKNAQMSPANQLRIAHQKMALAKALQSGDYGRAYSAARTLAGMVTGTSRQQPEEEQ